MNKDIKKTGTAEPVKKAVGKDNVLKKVINVTTTVLSITFICLTVLVKLLGL